MSDQHNSKRGGASLVAAGIFLSRIAGLVRERIFAHYFGNSDAGDAFKAALKIPNFLQNLFGEGVLSASFIPVYAKLLAEKNNLEARHVANTVFSLLALLTSFLVLAGVFATPFLIGLIAPGFHDEKRTLTIHLVQIFFPGIGLLVLSAWCLGVLNSHRKFFLSYVAPVVWNCSIIALLLIFGGKSAQNELAITAAWGLVLGSALQFLVQLPTAFRLLGGGMRWSMDRSHFSVQQVIRNFFPVVLARGVVQISAYIDNLLASLLPTGAVSALAYAQVIYLLPVSLFGMSVSVAELPEMASASGASEEIAEKLRERLRISLERIAFYIVPSVAAFFFFGDIIVGALYQGGAFTRQNTIEVWGVLAGSTVGLLAATMGRLYSSTYYALRDTRTPLKFAVVRVFLTTVLGYIFAFSLPPLFHLPMIWGTAGLTASAGIAGWVEFYLLQRGLRRRIGAVGLDLKIFLKLWLAVLPAIALVILVRMILREHHPIFVAALTLIPFGALYFIVCNALGIGDRTLLNKIFFRK